MKSQRRAPAPPTLAPKTTSNASLKDSPAVEQDSDQDWLPPKVLLKPPGQILLTEDELNEELTRILNANNPHAPKNISRYNHKERVFKASPNVDHHITHFEFDGYLIYKGDEDISSPMDEIVEEKKKVPLKNQFNFSERAAQTAINPSRDRTTNTEPPPTRNFNATVNQWSIFDAYVEDLSMKEKIAKEKNKSSNTGKTQKDDEKHVLEAQHAAVAAMSGPGEESLYKNTEFRKALIIIERMANQNTFDEIAQDFKYWEDASDEMGDRKNGSLLPLWKFVCEKDKRKMVTAVCWNPGNSDLFAVGYGSYDFSKQGPGIIACFTLKNPSSPEFLYNTEAGVMCLDFHPQHPSMIAVGLYDGSVLVYNLQKKIDAPSFKSSTKAGKHADPVWQVTWQKDDLDENLNFFSISSDGRVTQWTLLQTELIHTDVIHLKYSTATPTSDDEPLFSLAGGCCFDFHKSIDHLFVVGTEEGRLHKCSKSYINEYLLSYEAHTMSVYSVRYNPFHGKVFLSASADWTVKLWDHTNPKPLVSFDLQSPVGDVAWSPYSSTIFAAVTADGKVFVFDLHENKYEAVCEQQVVKKSKLTHCAFNAFEPILLVGDEKGVVVSLKLSPNLRRVNDIDCASIFE